MKKGFVLSIAYLFIVHMLIAQASGTITYKETIKMDIQLGGDMPKDIDISQYLPESTTFKRDLHFKGNESIYVNSKEEEAPEDKTITSDDGSFQLVIGMDDDVENIRYINRVNKNMVEQTGFMGKSFIITEDVPKIKWKMTNEKVMYLDFECTKATATIDERNLVAWFAPQIPAQVGPEQYGALPGAILMLNIDDGKTEIMATAVNLEGTNFPIEAPKKGKKVTAEEFDKIVDERTKEMHQQAGEGTFIIRGN